MSALTYPLVGFAFFGWCIMLAGVAYMQKADSRQGDRNFRQVLQDKWWLMSLQIVVILYTVISASAPAKKIGAAALLAVLTTLTFLETRDTLTKLTFGGSYVIPSPGYSTAALPASLLVNSIYKADGREHPSLFGYNKITRGTLVWFAGLLVVDIANVLLAMHVAEESSTVSAIKEVAKDVEAAAEPIPEVSA